MRAIFAGVPAMPPMPRPVPPQSDAWTIPAHPAYSGAAVVDAKRRVWSGVSAVLTEVRCEGEMRVRLQPEHASLSIVLDAVGGRLEVRSHADPGPQGASGASRPMSVIPAGIEASGHSRRMRSMRHLVIAFHRSRLAEMLDEVVDLEAALSLRLMFSDQRLMRLGQLVAEECESGKEGDRLYGDSLSVALLLRLSQLNKGDGQAPKRGGLAPWQLRRAIEYLQDHLAEDVSLQALADLTQLSQSYFSRAFKTSTGLPPHQWLMKARFARAKQLLIEGRFPLAEIALDVGFCDQAHFTRSFSRAIGVSPGAWQRTQRG